MPGRLKRGDPEYYRYDVTTMTLPTLNLSRTRRVVFGNACKWGPAESGLPPGLAMAFFGQEGLNVVATFAPISRDVALGFARSFYEQLLGANSETGLPVAEALWSAKRHYTPNADADPSYLFYCLCGPPHTRFVADAG